MPKFLNLDGKNGSLVSVILPIQNEAGSIEAVLQAILCQDYPGEMEILVVDGMSTDDTRAIIAGICGQHAGINLRILDNPGKIVPTGMNIALREAIGEYIIRVDGHTLIAPDYVRTCVELLQSSGAENVGGRMYAEGETPFGQVVAVATSSSFGIGDSKFHYSEEEESVDSVYMGAWPRRVFEQVGLFDDEMVRDQDDEFNYRLRAAGGRILLSPRIKSTYTVRGTPKTLWRQYYQYGYWKIRVLQKQPGQMSLRQFVPALFVLGLVGSLLLIMVPGLAPAGWMLPLLYVAANLAASILAAGRLRWRQVALLPVVYAILHLAYGSGCLVGLVAFAHRWGDKIAQKRTLLKI